MAAPRPVNKTRLLIVGLVAILIIGVVEYNREPVVERKASTAENLDVPRLDNLGKSAVSQGFATEYEVSGWGQTLDLTISSLLPGDARTLAVAVCEAARVQGLHRGWTVRVFLPMGGDRPAATCEP